MLRLPRGSYRETGARTVLKHAVQQVKADKDLENQWLIKSCLSHAINRLWENLDAMQRSEVFGHRQSGTTARHVDR